MTEQVSGNPTDTPIVNPQDTTPAQPDPLATLLAEIKDESGRQKYTDPVTALVALKEAQEYIPKLRTEINTLKDRVETQHDMKTVEELLAMTQPTSEPTTPEPVTPATPETVEPTMEEQFMEFLSKKEAQDKQRANQASVTDALSARFGEKKDEVYAAKAQELGVSPDTLNALAAQSPAAVLAYFDVQKAPATVSAQSTVNSASLSTYQEPAKPKPVAYGASRTDIQAAWEACRPAQ